MKNFLSMALVAAPLVLLAPNNTAEAVSSFADLLAPKAVAQTVALPVGTMIEQAASNVSTAAEVQQQSDPITAWIMAAGFLVLVMMRRMRGE